MNPQAGVVPIAVILWIAIGALLAGGFIGYFVLGRNAVASVGLGIVIGIVVAPPLIGLIRKWLKGYDPDK